MRVGPSDSDCRVRVQTTGSGVGPMAGVVSVSEKAGYTRQVRAGKTNVSEPLVTCRKRRDVIETGLQLLVRDAARGKPVDWVTYFRYGHPRRTFRTLNYYLQVRFRCFLRNRSHRRSRPFRRGESLYAGLRRHGLRYL